MEFDQLRQLDAIDRTGTVLAAAQRLHLSQPALSRSIQRLEADLGAKLLTRSGRRVELNETGRVALDWARQILRDERLMRDAVLSAAHRAETIRVGTVAPAPLWRLTGLMIERLPQETLTSETLPAEDVIDGVLNGTFDLGIVEGKPHVPGLANCSLMQENLSVALPPNHPLATRRSVSAEELDGNSFLIQSNIGFWRERVDRALPHALFIEQEDRTVFARLAGSTPHCTFVTDVSFGRQTETGRIVVPIDDAVAHAEFYLVARAEAEGTIGDLFRWACMSCERENRPLD